MVYLPLGSACSEFLELSAVHWATASISVPGWPHFLMSADILAIHNIIDYNRLPREQIIE